MRAHGLEAFRLELPEVLANAYTTLAGTVFGIATWICCLSKV